MGEQEHEARPALIPSTVGAQGRRAARKRLLTARGHLDAVLRMLGEDRYCIDILHQLSAVEAAITRSRRDILEGHLRGCLTEAVRGGGIGTGDAADEVLATVFGGRAPAARKERRAVLLRIRPDCDAHGHGLRLGTPHRSASVSRSGA